MSTISLEAWADLRLAIELYVSGLCVAWSHPDFDPVAKEPIFTGFDRFEMKTEAGESPALLPTIGRPIRGVLGTKARVTGQERGPSILRSIRLPFGYGSHDAGKPAAKGRAFLEHILSKHKDLLNALRIA